MYYNQDRIETKSGYLNYIPSDSIVE